MAKRVFISFRWHEKGWRNDLLRFFQAYGGPVQATPASMNQDMSDRGEDKIKEAIRQQMDGCDAVIVVVGDDVHNSPWIEWEGGVANELKIRKFGMRHPAAKGGFPNAHAGMQEIPWDPAEMARIIDAL
ncbi:MAG TPA: TIR domain-containing protein [Longimicrobium sp.]|jgi:hypothetical protein